MGGIDSPPPQKKQNKRKFSYSNKNKNSILFQFDDKPEFLGLFAVLILVCPEELSVLPRDVAFASAQHRGQGDVLASCQPLAFQRRA